MRSLAIKEKAYGPDHPDVASRLYGLAKLYDAQGRYKEAEPLFLRSLAIYEQSYGPDHSSLANMLNSLAGLYWHQGRYGESEKLYLRSLAIYEKAYGPESLGVASAIGNLAWLYKTQGRYGEAEPLYLRSLVIKEQAYGPDHPNVANSLIGLAQLYETQGRYGKAELLYLRSLAIKEKAYDPNHPDVATALSSLAVLYDTQGRNGEAEPLYLRSLAIYEKAHGPDHPDVATALTNLAFLYKDLGRYGEAEQFFQRSLAIREKAYDPDHPEVAMSLVGLAALYGSQARYEEAEKFYRRAIVIHEKASGPGHPRVGDALSGLAYIYEHQGRYREAEPLYKRALPIVLKSDELNLQRGFLASLADFNSKQGRTPLAIFFGKKSVNLTQKLRHEVSHLTKDQQRGFLKDKSYIYKDLADWLIELGRLPEAQQVLAMLKEEEYFDFIQRSSTNGDVRETRAALTPTEQAAEDKLSKPSDELARLGKRVAELRAKDERGQLSEGETAEMDRLQDALVEAEETFLAALDELTTVFAKAGRETEVARKNLEDLTALQDTLRELGHGAVLIHAFMMPEKVRLLLTTSEIQLSRDAAIKEGDLNKMIHAFRQVLKAPQLDPQPQAQALYDLIIKPLRKDLEATGAKTLMLSLDGTLRYIPMAALHDGEAYLGERYALALYTEAAKDKLKDKPKGQWKLSGFGVTKAHGNLNPLPAVATELNGLVGEGGVLPGKALLDETFTAKALQRSLRRGSPVVHLASHFVFKPGTVADSFLLLGDGSHLSLQTLGSAKYRFRGVDLLTLSACETAVGGGGRKANGREIEGFGILAQRQGAKGVVATLWPVADRSTGEFMKLFYRIRQETKGITKAEALRQAQVVFIKGKQAPMLMASADARKRGFEPANDNGIKNFTAPKDAPFAHPYYWAPFILMGNWL